MLVATGCLAPYPEVPDPEQVRLRTEIGNLRQNVDRLQNRLDSVHQEQETLLRELDQLRRAARERDQTIIQTRTEADRRFQALESAREADRQFFIDEVTRRIAEHLTRTAAPTPTRTTPRTERGRVHEVKPGETLSEIAAAYAVQVNAIVRANEIDNPDRLRVGQRLFIPD